MEMSLRMTSGMLWMCCRILSYSMVPSDGVWKESFFFFFSSPESSTSAVRGGLGQEMQNVN